MAHSPWQFSPPFYLLLLGVLPVFSASVPIVAGGLILPSGGRLDEGSSPLPRGLTVAFTIYRHIAT